MVDMSTTLSSQEAKARLDAEVCAEASKFIQLYNMTADSNRRGDIVHLYVGDDPLLLWNGNPFKGKEEIGRFWNTFPETKHEVTSLDAHPVSVKTPASAEKSLVLQAMGTVTINGVSRAYNQVLILQLAGGNYHIKSDSHRLIE